MSDSSEVEMEIQGTPPEIKKAASEAVQNLLPQKSSGRYEKTYIAFKTWCENKGVRNINSESVILAYFSELAKDKKSSTLWSTYSMLKSTLNIKENIDISISKIPKLGAFLKKENMGYKPKKSNTFSKNDVDKFLKAAPIEFLPQKVALILGISGACRSDELFKMNVNDLNFLDDKVTVSIPDTKTHNSRGFIISNAEWIAILKQYINLRQNIDNNRLFMQLRYNKITKQPFGHNSIASFPKKIATFLKLDNPSTFTGHCFRRTAATLLADNGGDILQLKRLGGWKSSAVAEGYVDNSLGGQTKIANMLSHPTNIHAPSTSTTHDFTFSNEQTKHGISLVINASGNTNVTLNFNNCNPN